MNRKEIFASRHKYDDSLWKKDNIELPEIHEKDPILTTIFAVNPVTGKPSCDLGLVFSANTSVEVQQYIRNQLAVANSSISSVSNSADDALTVVKSQFETTDQYIDRIRDFVNQVNNPVTDNNPVTE